MQGPREDENYPQPESPREGEKYSQPENSEKEEGVKENTRPPTSAPTSIPELVGIDTTMALSSDYCPTESQETAVRTSIEIYLEPLGVQPGDLITFELDATAQCSIDRRRRSLLQFPPWDVFFNLLVELENTDFDTELELINAIQATLETPGYQAFLNVQLGLAGGDEATVTNVAVRAAEGSCALPGDPCPEGCSEGVCPLCCAPAFCITGICAFPS